ncbi:MAG: glycosyltransferase family 4 protein [Chitinophagaceae bacterium]
MKLLLILNTPPPYQGTTIMNQFLLDALQEKHIEYTHLRIDSSKELKTLGKFDFNKLRSAFNILIGIYANRKDYQMAYLVMSVEGFAFYRHSIFILLLLLLKKKYILHLRGLGFRNKKGPGKILTSFIFKRSYLIQHSIYNSFDIAMFGNKKVFYVPNGWQDYYKQFRKEVESRIAKTTKDVNIVFLSNLIADKGLFTVAESMLNISLDPLFKGASIKWNFVGNWESESVKKSFFDYINANKLYNYIGHIGPLYNDEKYLFLAGMDILTFPTFYKHETWGNVILEAMMFKIPVIATRYVAIPEMVKDNETGFLINREDPVALADRVKVLIKDRERGKRMGEAGRRLYLQHFQLDTFKKNIIEVLQTVNR